MRVLLVAVEKILVAMAIATLVAYAITASAAPLPRQLDIAESVLKKSA